MPDSDFENIKPAEIEINAGKAPPEVSATATATPTLGERENREYADYQRRNTRILWGIFGVLLFLVLGVLFVLPDMVDPAAISQRTPQVTAPQPTRPAINTVSPYEEAQRLQQREAAQNTLAELLEVQDALELMEVETWATEDFSAAIEQARLGDETYREQSFLLARDHYQQGLDLLTGIQNRADQVFDNFMRQGAQAINEGEPELAVESYQLAMAINPESTAADNGLARAQVLDQVLILLNNGLELHESNNFEAAREQYRQALNLDAEHQASRESLARVNQAITDRDFSNLMSQGYAALSNTEPEQAQTYFQRALAIKPASDEAQSAIDQAADQISSSRINAHLDTAYEHESAERWSQAVEEFNQALAIDPNIVAAVNGLSRAKSRLNLDSFMEATLEEPLRLADETVYRQTIDVYTNALRIENPGPKLQRQLEAVYGYLQKAREPVSVSLTSNGMTSVTVYQVGELGQFTNHSLNLIPGSYTAVGVRDGYRDVREDFVVAFDGQPPVIHIACEEQVL